MPGSLIAKVGSAGNVKPGSFGGSVMLGRLGSAMPGSLIANVGSAGSVKPGNLGGSEIDGSDGRPMPGILQRVVIR